MKKKFQNQLILCNFVTKQTYQFFFMAHSSPTREASCARVRKNAPEGNEIKNALDLAESLEPLLGSVAKYAISLGLVAAGFSSAITAPLAAAYVAQGCFGWESDIKSARFRGVWIIVLALGVLALSFSYRPIQIIQLAQFANGLLLPLVAIILLYAMNQSSVLKSNKNTRVQNAIGLVIVLITLVLGTRSVLGVLGLWG